MDLSGHFDGYELLLTSGSDVRPSESSTNGYSDLIEEGKIYWDTSFKVLYGFDGHRYRAMKCWERQILRSYQPTRCGN
jgi:hypothetical protein